MIGEKTTDEMTAAFGSAAKISAKPAGRSPLYPSTV